MNKQYVEREQKWKTAYLSMKSKMVIGTYLYCAMARARDSAPTVEIRKAKWSRIPSTGSRICNSPAFSEVIKKAYMMMENKMTIVMWLYWFMAGTEYNISTDQRTDA